MAALTQAMAALALPDRGDAPLIYDVVIDGGSPIDNTVLDGGTPEKEER